MRNSFRKLVNPATTRRPENFQFLKKPIATRNLIVRRGRRRDFEMIAEFIISNYEDVCGAFSADVAHNSLVKADQIAEIADQISNEWSDSWDPHLRFFLLLHERHSNEMIGYLEVMSNDSDPQLRIASFIAPDYRGNRFAQEALSNTFRQLSKEAGLKNLIAMFITNPNVTEARRINTAASQKNFRRMGFKFVGRRNPGWGVQQTGGRCEYFECHPQNLRFLGHLDKKIPPGHFQAGFSVDTLI